MKRFFLLIIINGLLFTFALGREICREIKSYSIDVVREVMDDSLEWQKKLSSRLSKDGINSINIEKIIELNDANNKITFSFVKDKIIYGYVEKAKSITIKYEDSKFYIKRSYNKNFRKVSDNFTEKYSNYIITLKRRGDTGITILYKNDNRQKINLNFYLLSARYVYICKFNIEYPFKLISIHTPDSYLSDSYLIGHIIFVYDRRYYKLNVFKDFKGNLFTYYYEVDSLIPKYAPLISRRGSYYILDFNKAFYHLCIHNNKIPCADVRMKMLAIELPIKAGEKLV